MCAGPQELCGAWKKGNCTPKNTEVVIGCPATHLAYAAQAMPSGWEVAAENCYLKASVCVCSRELLPEGLGVWVGGSSMPLLLRTRPEGGCLPSHLTYSGALLMGRAD